ncbi:MAG: tRNA pseudouridine(55) synthase TruB [Candidatus Eremiobacteraeota bacterium]|nr:tRNA pseudouridine(55) synthase TruB [Candidatus Eremiobacteraeota bacterium]
MALSRFGFINACKPVGISSAAFGNWVKRITGSSAVGHWGTLDPNACGVLVLALDRATRLLPLMPHARKRYIFELIVGVRTDSADSSGVILEQAAVPARWREGLSDAVRSFVGTISQLPPMHSALKVGGRALYRSAHAGMSVPRKAREVRIEELRVLDQAQPTQGARPDDRARLFVECAAGTYVRVLCEDLGRALGMPAHMGMLVRVGAGDFSLRDAVLPEELARSAASAIIDPLHVLPLPRVALDLPSARRFVFGNDVKVDARGVHADLADGGELLLVHERQLLGSGRFIAATGVVAPTRVLAYPAELA